MIVKQVAWLSVEYNHFAAWSDKCQTNYKIGRKICFSSLGRVNKFKMANAVRILWIV